MKKIEIGIIEKNIAITSFLKYLKIKLPLIAKEILPGNFISILPPAQSGRFIRRPFSVAGVLKDSIELIIKKTGAVTNSLSLLNENEEIEVMGPLGNNYSSLLQTGKLWMIGGGTGVASLLFLNSQNINAGIEGNRVLWAGRNISMLPFSPGAACSGSGKGSPVAHLISRNITFATDDGSLGEKGTSAEILLKWLENSKPDAIVSCGPIGMLKEIKKIADNANIPAWFSLEEFMACGAGACAGCAVKAADSNYFKVCSDGPIFKSSDIIL
jgi:dihydroorotate dehydrogenase electron transfer subunit